jgi:hypothetical protein
MCLAIALASPEFITKLIMIINKFLTSERTPTRLKISLNVSGILNCSFYLHWTWFRYLSPAVIRGHFPLHSARVPSDRLALGFKLSVVYVIPLLSSSWHFKRREVSHIRFNVYSEVFST